MKRIRSIILTLLLSVATFSSAFTVPVNAKTAIDPTLAVPPAFVNSAYAILNPTTAANCNYDVTKMYNYYMSKGVKSGQRLVAAPTMTAQEMLFLYMSNNRKTYVSKGLKGSFPYFNVNNYVAANPDLVPVFGNNMSMYLYHYVNFGIYEGRSSGTLFDPAKVITANYAVAALDNPKLSPDKIYKNYVALTGLMTTAGSNVVVQPVATTVKPVVYGGPCCHEWEYINLPEIGKHKKRCRICCETDGEYWHSFECISPYCGADTCSLHTVKCTTCGYSMGEGHKDVNGNGKCDICGLVIGSHTHSYTSVSSAGSTATYHLVRCSCGAFIKAGHSFSAGFCTECGHEDPSYTPPHSHSYSYTSNGDGTHNGNCACGEDAISGEACSPSGSGESCSKCGYVTP